MPYLKVHLFLNCSILQVLTDERAGTSQPKLGFGCWPSGRSGVWGFYQNFVKTTTLLCEVFLPLPPDVLVKRNGLCYPAHEMFHQVYLQPALALRCYPEALKSVWDFQRESDSWNSYICRVLNNLLTGYALGSW